MRWLALALGCALLVAGCGGGGREKTTPASTSADPGRDVFALLAASARAGNGTALAQLLTRRCRRPGSIRRLESNLEPFAHGYRVLVSERITHGFGLVAVSRRANAFALPLKLVGGRWFADVCGPMSIEALAPRPGSLAQVPQLEIGVHGRGADTAVLYVDGLTVQEPRLFSTATEAQVFANLPAPFGRGRHVAVAFVRSDGYAAAKAWTFDAR